jgi:hypothetical protein
MGQLLGTTGNLLREFLIPCILQEVIAIAIGLEDVMNRTSSLLLQNAPKGAAHKYEPHRLNFCLDTRSHAPSSVGRKHRTTEVSRVKWTLSISMNASYLPDPIWNDYFCFASCCHLNMITSTSTINTAQEQCTHAMIWFYFWRHATRYRMRFEFETCETW